ncbi:MAG: ribonuclease Y, partial [Spirochaetota bacterium]|nr:ribonuclease Y [Spirochaetota bacterium]
PGARRESLETYLSRLKNLEVIASGFKGVEKCYAIQAGREIRVLVSNDIISDEKAQVLVKDIAKKIESDLKYPGIIRVTLIRETRVIDYAK